MSMYPKEIREELERLDNRELLTSDVKDRVALGAIGALIGGLFGALTGPFADVCVLGDCFERGSMASIIGATLIAATLGAFLVPSFLLSQKDD